MGLMIFYPLTGAIAFPPSGFIIATEGMVVFCPLSGSLVPLLLLFIHKFTSSFHLYDHATYSVNYTLCVSVLELFACRLRILVCFLKII